MCGGFTVPHGCRFRSALFSSRTVGFPESGWRRQLLSRCLFPAVRWLKCSLTSTLASTGYKFRFVARWPTLQCSGSLPGCGPRHNHCQPRSPLRVERCCRSRPALKGAGRRALPRLHRSYRLMRQTARLPSASVWCLVLRVFAGCVESLLPVGPSRRYLCDPCTVAWVLPRHARAVHLSVSSRPSSASP